MVVVVVVVDVVVVELARVGPCFCLNFICTCHQAKVLDKKKLVRFSASDVMIWVLWILFPKYLRNAAGH